MIEKRTLWIVDHDDQGIDSVTALYDTESNNVLAINYDSNTSVYYSNPRSGTQFYGTKEEAQTALEEHRKWLRDMMPQVKAFLDEIISYLTTVCRQQKLCINGCTFPISQVRRVNWYYNKAELELTDGSFGGSSSVTTCNKAELEVVKILFGENTSGTTFNR